MSTDIIPAATNQELFYRGEVAKALVAMSRLLKEAPERDAYLVEMWTHVLQEAGVQAQFIVPAAIKLLADPNREDRQFFPTPAVLIGYALDLAFVPEVYVEPTEEERRARCEEARRKMAADRAYHEAVRAAKAERQGATLQ